LPLPVYDLIVQDDKDVNIGVMTHITQKNSSSDQRPRIALITNHGYAGVDIPLGGAPDTGGQNFYVNSLATALEESGWEVTIFARGGFPFFNSDKIREETEKLSEHVRYVYIPGGGNTFLRKEDIAIALDEETAWLQNFINKEATALGVEPWNYYEIVNTHYWDAAVIAVKLVERWRDRAAQAFLAKTADGKLTSQLKQFSDDDAHRLGLSREIHFHVGEIAMAAIPESDPKEIIEALTAQSVNFDPGFDPGADKRPITTAITLGEMLCDLLQVDALNLTDTLDRIDTHVWTPHSIGIIKERNFWDKDTETIRGLKFRERDTHEQVICNRTPLFCSTSPEIWRTLVSYHGVPPEHIFDFPPCIDARIFRPRKKDELGDVYRYLAKQSGIDEEKLKNSLIVFETSRMDRTKRKDVLLQAFAKVAKNRDDVYLFIGGGPAGNPIFKSLEKLKETLPALKGRGFLLGFIPDDVLEPLFSAADLFVSASEMEGFGMSVSQAAAAGVPVVSSDLIPFATQFSKGAAVVVEAGNVDGFANAIERLLGDESERRERAERLLEVAGELDWVATAIRFISWFRDTHL
jgi:glycosyltransferase involved in cell wall biosynthesis